MCEYVGPTLFTFYYLPDREELRRDLELTLQAAANLKSQENESQNWSLAMNHSEPKSNQKATISGADHFNSLYNHIYAICFHIK